MPQSRYAPVEIDLKRETALRAIEQGVISNLTEAAELVNVPDSTLQMWRDASPEFKRRWDAAMARAKARTYDKVESVMVQRALDPRNPVGVTAGIFLLKSNRPTQYADKPTTQGVNVTVHIDRAQINLAGQTVEEMRTLEAPDEVE